MDILGKLTKHTYMPNRRFWGKTNIIIIIDIAIAIAVYLFCFFLSRLPVSQLCDYNIIISFCIYYANCSNFPYGQASQSPFV